MKLNIAIRLQHSKCIQVIWSARFPVWSLTPLYICFMFCLRSRGLFTLISAVSVTVPSALLYWIADDIFIIVRPRQTSVALLRESYFKLTVSFVLKVMLFFRQFGCSGFYLTCALCDVLVPHDSNPGIQMNYLNPAQRYGRYDLDVQRMPNPVGKSSNRPIFFNTKEITASLCSAFNSVMQYFPHTRSKTRLGPSCYRRIKTWGQSPTFQKLEGELWLANCRRTEVAARLSRRSWGRNAWRALRRLRRRLSAHVSFSSPELLVLFVPLRVALDAGINSNFFIGWWRMNAHHETKFYTTTHGTLLPDRKLAGKRFLRKLMATGNRWIARNCYRYVAVVKKQKMTCVSPCVS